MDIKNISDGILSDKSRVISMEEQSKELDSFKKKYEDYDYNFKKIDQLFLNSKNPVGFIRFLEETAKDSGINEDIKLDIFLPDKSSDDSTVIISSVFARGEFKNILNFFERLDASPYLMRIKNTAIEKSSGDSTVNAVFSAETLSK